MSSFVNSLKSLIISSIVMPDANQPKMSATVIRIPRIQGLPPRFPGSIVMICLYSVIYRYLYKNTKKLDILFMNGETTALTPNESLCKTHFTFERSNHHKGVPLSYTRIRGIMKEAIKAAGIHKQACMHSLHRHAPTSGMSASYQLFSCQCI